MADPLCKECKKPVPQGELLEGICADCIYSLAARQRGATREKIRELARAVEEETAGLVSPDALRSLIGQAIERAQAGEPKDDVEESVACEIQRLAGLGMCREMTKFAENMEEVSRQVSSAITDAAEAARDEVRRKVAKLSKLGGRS